MFMKSAERLNMEAVQAPKNRCHFVYLVLTSNCTPNCTLRPKILYLLSLSVLTTIIEGGPSPFAVNATTEILYLTNSFSPVRFA